MSGEFLYITLDREWTRRRSIPFNHIAFSVDEELGEVPLDTPIPEPSLLRFEELIQWMSIAPIHIDLREEGKGDSEVDLADGFDRLIGLRFLSEELIAGKSEDHEIIM